MRKYTLSLLLCCFFTSLFAQQQDTRFYPIDAPISQNTVVAIAQDKHGFIWAATRYGLNKFDGLKYTTFNRNPSSTEGLPSDNITELIADADGNLIIGTLGYGFSFFDVDKQKFTSYRHEPDNPNSLSSNEVNCLYEDKNGILWIGTERGGLNVFDRESQSFERYFQEGSDAAVSFYNIKDIKADAKDNMIFGTRGQGIAILQRGSNKVVQLNMENTPELTSNEIKKMLLTEDGEMWLTTAKGIKKLHSDEQNNFSISNPFPGKDRLSKILNKSDFLSIEECPKGVIWFGTENNGLFKYDTQTEKIEQFLQDSKNLNSIPSNSIWSIHADRDNIIWLGFYFKGLAKIDPLEQKFRPIYDFKEEDRVYDLDLVSSFAEEMDGSLWIGMDGKGLYRVKPDGAVSIFNDNSGHNLQSNNITDVELDNEGNLYVATWGSGVKYLAKGAKKFTNIDLVLYESESAKIMNLMLDKKERLWVNNYQNGIEIIDTKTLKNLKFKSGRQQDLGSDQFHSIEEDQFGNIWLGSTTKGITRISVDDQGNLLELKSLQEFSENAQLNENIISSIYTASDGKIWIGTRSRGLFYYDASSLQTHLITDKVKLPTNNIYSINEDDDGHIWAGTNKGLIRLNPETLEVDHFQESDGLQSNEFFKNSTYRSKSGKLYFGGISGFNSFYADDFVINKKIPKVYITDLEISGEKQSITKGDYFNNSTFSFNHKFNDLSIGFSAISYSQASKNIYKYRLEGYEEAYHTVQNEQTARYPNLSPGNYTFQLSAANNDKVWTDEFVELEVIIQKPWYMTHLAFFLYFVILTSFFIWRRNSLISRQRLRYDLKLQQVDLEKLKELDRMKSRFYTNISHELKTPVTLIISPLKSIIAKLSEKSEGATNFKVMLNNAEQLYRLINQIMQLSKIEAGKAKLRPSEMDINSFLKSISLNFSGYADARQIRYEIDLVKKDKLLFFDPEKLERVFVNLISNAFKYTSKYGRVKISTEENPNWVFIMIEDNGIGIKKEDQAYVFDRFYRSREDNNQSGTGIGLELAKQIVEQHNGYIILESEPNERTVFKVALRKGKRHFAKNIRIRDEKKDFQFSEESIIELQNYQVQKKVPVKNDKIIKPEKENKALILIVEDNKDLREFLHNLLSEDYKVITAKNGVEGYDLAKTQKPKLVITDAMMPEMDGFEMSKRIKDNPNLSHLFIIMTTVKSSKTSREKAYQHGIDALITKPFDPEMLMLRIKNFLNVKRNIKANIFNHENLTASTNTLEDFLPFKEADERFIKDVVKIIEDNLRNQAFNIEELCKQMGVSKSNLYRKVKAILGCTTNELIRKTRIKKAAYLLKNSELKISEITYRVGFNDLQYFRKCFKEVYNMTPSEFAKANKENTKKINSTINN